MLQSLLHSLTLEEKEVLKRSDTGYSNRIKGKVIGLRPHYEKDVRFGDGFMEKRTLTLSSEACLFSVDSLSPQQLPSLA